MADSRANGCEPLLICPDRAMSAGLVGLLARELPGTPGPEVLDEYPGRQELFDRVQPAAGGLCFLDASSDAEEALALISALSSGRPAAAVIALLRRDDPELILQCLRQGAGEFLIYPFTADQLKAALSRVSRLNPRPREEREGRIICVMPGKGAAGATTVACNLAFALARQAPGKVLLADLDGLTGTVPFLLKLKSSYSFVDALAHAGSLDADMWKVLVTPCRGIDVLLSPENPVDSISAAIDPAGILSYSRRAYGTTVVDCGGAFGGWNLALARLAGELLMVTTNEPAVLHGTQRSLAYLEENGVARSAIRIILNLRQPGAGLSREDSEEALNARVFSVLPNDHEGIRRALMEGRPAAPSSRFGKSLAALARQLGGGLTEGSGRPGVLAGFFRRLAPKKASPRG
jgi:pilus assembly protein CpaE